MKVLTLLNEKGGVGKTTLAVHIAAGLARRGKRVLLIDTDMQGNATLAFGVKPEPGIYNWLVRSEEYGLKDVIKRIHDNRLAPPDEQPVSGRLYLIPSNWESRSLPHMVQDGIDFVKRIRALSSAVDLVVFDTSPTQTMFHSAIYAATDAILYPTNLEEWGWHGVQSAWKRRENADMVRKGMGLDPIQVIGIQPTLFDRRYNLHHDLLKRYRDEYGYTVLEPIAKRVIYAEAPSAYCPVFTFAPTSKAARDMWKLVAHVEGVLNVESQA